MKKLLLTLGLLAVLVQGAGAWRPAGWVYHNHPWAYDSATGDWHWFNTPDTQWVVNMSNGRWARLPNSALATGWVYYNWAFAYAQSNGAWHWINETDRQWVINMRTGTWSRFGVGGVPPVSPAPAGMVLIPGGTNAGTDPDFGAYSVTVNSFYFGRHEVTKAQWDEVRAWAIANGYTFDNSGSGKGPTHPVQSINWYDAVKWCNARSEMEGRPVMYYASGVIYRTGRRDNVLLGLVFGQSGYMLPTARQWEFAARGGATGRRFPWADTQSIFHERANYQSSDAYGYDSSPTRGYHPMYFVGVLPYTSPVGSFAANGYGLFDMAGNVAELCFDLHPDHPGMRQMRGGSWWSSAAVCRVGYRAAVEPGYTGTILGFRVVIRLDL